MYDVPVVVQVCFYQIYAKEEDGAAGSPWCFAWWRFPSFIYGESECKSPYWDRVHRVSLLGIGGCSFISD